MAFKENEFDIALRAVNQDVWDVKFRIKGYELTTKECHWHIDSICWKTYNEVVFSDVDHYIENVWLKTAHLDVFELIELVKKAVLGQE